MKKIRKIIAVTILVLIFIVSFFLFILVQDDSIKNFSLSLIVSLLASLLFAIFSEVLFQDDSLEIIKNDLKEIKQVSFLNKDIYKYGLDRISMIAYQDEQNDLWLTILENATFQLDIIAHTLSPWFVDKYRDTFIEKVVFLSNNGIKVNILILDPNGKNLNYIDVGDLERYREKIQRSIDWIYKIYDKIDEDKRQNLDVRLNSEFVIPYSYIRNDNNIYISPYLCSTGNRSSFIVSVKSKSSIGEGFILDFEQIFNEKKVKKLEHIILVKTKSTLRGKYSSRTWNYEDTYKYVFRINDMTVEAGYYIHYFNNEIIDKTIELSTSYGCVFKCKYCASSKIDKFKIISVDDNLKIIEKICEINHIDNNENLIIALTGTGDYRCTYKYANNLIVKVKQCYPNSKFIISSCAWNSSLIQQAQHINKDYFLFLQLTYISYDREKVEKIIPCYPCDFSIDGLEKLIGESSLGEKFRINYLMINNINDTEADFDKFIAIISPIKRKILVRISKLNETSCSKNNGLYATHDNNLELLKSKCKQNGIEAYIFKAYQNDNMNCGQLVTDEDK